MYLVCRNLFLLAGGRTGDEKLWLFEILAHNPQREPGRGAIFLFLSPVTH
jgi:hypothetical protein